MQQFDWAKFLKKWNEYVFASSLAETLPADARSAKWAGCPGATEQQIANAEKRLKISLPPSFRSFLLASNGWLAATDSIQQIRGTEQLNWFRKENADWIKAYQTPRGFGPEPVVPDEEYFACGPNGQDFRRSHLREALQISEVEDGAVYLLNPQVISADGEWEAWFFANWLPGAQRHRSFQEMMEAQFHEFAGLEWAQLVGVQGALPDEYIGSPGSPKRRVKQRKKPREPRLFGKPLKSWPVEKLLAMLERRDFDVIHGDVIDALGKLEDPRALEILLKMGREGNVQAMYALKRSTPQELPEMLLKTLHRREFLTFHAVASLLAELRVAQAVPVLAEVIRDATANDLHLGDGAATNLARFGAVGFDALVELTCDPDPTIRRRAVSGLLCTNSARARDALQPLLDDPDPTVREVVASAMNVLPVSIKTITARR